MHHRGRLCVLALFFLAIAAGCSSDRNILERVGYVRTVGFDAEKDNMIRVTVNIPLIIAEANETRQQEEIFSKVVRSSKEARILMSRRTSRKMVSGQINTILFNEELSRRGLWSHMDSLLRDFTISKRTEIAVVEESARDIIETHLPGHSRTNQYIDRMLKKEFETQTLPHVLLHHFCRDYFDEGRDPITPFLSKSGKDLEVSGIALFKKDRMVGKLSANDIFYFSIIYHDQDRGEFTLGLNRPELYSISFHAINNTTRKTISKTPDGRYRADIRINIHGGVTEYIGNLKMSTSERTELEHILSRHIEEECNRVVKKLQQLGVDSIGIGQYVRNKVSYQEWKAFYKDNYIQDMDIVVHTNFKVKNFGNFFY
ncbi:Ger(x)C family spore germination protein [Paenibacillus brevis]|uniref:Ger(X)C family spore germination protein n=1 Tax=Paenibacillus brevis TaxID=2841508 RepID=A0ABS6FM14_9BACL|nr:Ger(x)C family spore germination protein [Paenibacillus brevis]MBU5671211.1 Ger(x)C family spore germination protein [Paenibacillus brevis]